MSLKPVNVEDYRIFAQSRLPKIIIDYLEGGADDEIGMKHSPEVFDCYRLRPRRLIDLSKRDTGVELFSRHQTAPFMIGSTGLNGALWPRGEILLARAATKAGVSPFRYRIHTPLVCFGEIT
jgi:(S)-mandelate dehydrogenase